MTRVFTYCCWTPALLLAGCLNVHEQSRVGPTPHYQVKCGGDCLELNTTGTNDRNELLRAAAEHLKEKRPAAVELIAANHLEAVIDILRRRDPRTAPTEAELTLARAVDALLLHPTADGWLQRLQSRGAGGLETAENALRRAMDAQRNQQWSKAAELVRQHRATIVAYPEHALRTGLIVAEAQRHLGQADAAAAAWQQTAVLAARLRGPDLLEQVAAQRPVTTAWPSEATAALMPRAPACLHGVAQAPNFAPEALVWFVIGQARMQRGEASAALTAFYRADSRGAFPLWDDFLSLHQGKALLGMGQTPAATSVLTTLVSRPPESPWRSPALALLGAGKFQEGHTRQACAFLREAVEEAAADYLGRADAEANLGLAYLAAGNEAKGLHWLHRAQERFGANADRLGLQQCLENEARYLQHTNRAHDADRIRQRLDTGTFDSAARK